MLQNHDLHIDVTINGSWWLSGDPTSQHGNIVPSQNDGQPLSQLPGDLLFLLPQLPCELPPQLGEHIKGTQALTVNIWGTPRSFFIRYFEVS